MSHAAGAENNIVWTAIPYEAYSVIQRNAASTHVQKNLFPGVLNGYRFHHAL